MEESSLTPAEQELIYYKLETLDFDFPLNAVKPSLIQRTEKAPYDLQFKITLEK